MWHHKRGSMQLDRDMSCSSNLEMLVLVSWSVGHVARNTLREFVYKIRMVGLIYIVHRRRGLLGMLVIVFFVSIQQWATNRQNTKNLSLRWTVRFMIKLFLF